MRIEPSAEQKKNMLENNARQYLLKTDWYVIRMQETGQAIPEDVLNKRANARIVLSNGV